MTKAIKQNPIVSDYVDLAFEENLSEDERLKKLDKYVAEYFGTDEDRDNEALNAFAKECWTKLEERMKETMMNAETVNTVEEAAEATAEAVEAKVVVGEVQTNAANDEVAVEASEAPTKG